MNAVEKGGRVRSLGTVGGGGGPYVTHPLDRLRRCNGNDNGPQPAVDERIASVFY